jgi:hypothetical protein
MLIPFPMLLTRPVLLLRRPKPFLLPQMRSAQERKGLSTRLLKLNADFKTILDSKNTARILKLNADFKTILDSALAIVFEWG